MTFFLAACIYVLAWWVILFMVLPFGIRRHGEEGKGHDAGAPETVDLKRKLILTSVFAALFVAAVWALDAAGFIRWHEWFDTWRQR